MRPSSGRCALDMDEDGDGDLIRAPVPPVWILRPGKAPKSRLRKITPPRRTLHTGGGSVFFDASRRKIHAKHKIPVVFSFASPQSGDSQSLDNPQRVKVNPNAVHVNLYRVEVNVSLVDFNPKLVKVNP